MIGTEWDLATALEVEREEGWEKGREEGREETAQNMLRKGFSYEQTAELSMLDIEKVRELSYTIQA
jgi:predicted transposase/invertase (TIGR01784 family)